MDSIMRVTRWVLACLVLLMILPGAAFAQAGRCTMEGFVVGEHDSPGLSGASVELIGEAGLQSIKLTAKAGDTGKYSLDDIPHGEYTLRVSAPGYLPYRISIYMLSDASTQLHVKLRKEKSPVQK
jgi:Carboxypeptidase regulatory-like domain